MTRKIITALSLFLFGVLTVHAQSTADKYYEQGEIAMATMTKSQQEKAIEAFSKAQIAYDSEIKKQECERHMTICKEIIKLIAKNDNLKKKLDDLEKAPAVSSTELSSSETSAQQAQAQLADNVQIEVSADNVVLAADCSEFQTISISSTYPEWHLQEDYPDEWLTCIEHSDQLRIIAQYNPNQEARAAKLSIVSGNAVCNIMVIQQGVTLGAKIKHGILTDGLFKGKKQNSGGME